MAVDGNIWVGLRNAQVVKLSNNAPASFSYHVPYSFGHLTQLYTNQSLADIFLVNAVTGHIVEIDKQGKYIVTMVVPSGLVTHMGQITLSGDGKTLYFVSGGSVYCLSVPS